MLKTEYLVSTSRKYTYTHIVSIIVLLPSALARGTQLDLCVELEEKYDVNLYMD